MENTVGTIIGDIKNQLKDTGYPNDEIMAITRRLLEHYTGSKYIDLYINPDKVIESNIKDKIDKAITQLNKNRPLQYVLGETEFYALKFKVNENVLIPRPETEELVQWIINDYQNIQRPSILDLGTGSGAIAVSLAKYLAQPEIYALDISAKALSVAKENAALNQADIRFIQMDILSKRLNLPHKFDCIVSNPPYVRNSEKKNMLRNVLDYEPHTALFVEDNNPLVYYKSIAEIAIKWLKENGSVYVEINEELGAETVKLFRNSGFNPKLKNDLNGKPRMIKADFQK